jgi:L-threonylcarbamoyladenylate synthase
VRALDADIDMVLDGGGAAGGLPSTVLDLTVSPPQVRRQGAVAL